MNGKIFIGDIDIYANFGVFVDNSGLNGLVQFPNLKEPTFNDWSEETGIEVDLLSPKVDSKTFTIRFCCDRQYGIERFLGLLDETGYHDFIFVDLGITRHLRLVSMPNRETIQPLKNFELQFSDDFYPFESYTRQNPERVNTCNQTGYTLDGKQFSDYGIWVRDGFEDEVLSAPNVKEAQLINSNAKHGVTYDNEANVVFESHDITIDLHLRATKDVFWKNWNAFFYDLIQQNERILGFESRTETYKFYYKSNQIQNFHIENNGDFWCDFSITICLTKHNIGDIYNVLGAGEVGMIIFDNINLAIDTTFNPLSNPS